MSPKITCASVLSGKTGKHENCIFHSLYYCIARMLDFFSLFDSRLILTLLYDSLNLVINAFSLGLLGDGSKERKSRTLQQLDSVACIKHQCAVFWVFLSQCNAEALAKWGRKTKHHLIYYFLSNTSAKTYRSRIVYVKIIASRRWDVFETQCIYQWTRSFSRLD